MRLCFRHSMRRRRCFRGLRGRLSLSCFRLSCVLSRGYRLSRLSRRGYCFWGRELPCKPFPPPLSHFGRRRSCGALCTARLSCHNGRRLFPCVSHRRQRGTIHCSIHAWFPRRYFRLSRRGTNTARRTLTVSRAVLSALLVFSFMVFLSFAPFAFWGGLARCMVICYPPPCGRYFGRGIIPHAYCTTIAGRLQYPICEFTHAPYSQNGV